jgi:hypothetical protein
LEIFSMILERVDAIPIRAPRKEAVRSGLNANDPVHASDFGLVRLVERQGIERLRELSITFSRIEPIVKAVDGFSVHVSEAGGVMAALEELPTS